jgi:hypothetical protein
MTMPWRRARSRFIRRAVRLQRQREATWSDRLAVDQERTASRRFGSAPGDDSPTGYSSVGDFSPRASRAERRADRGREASRDRPESGSEEGGRDADREEPSRRRQDTARETGDASPGRAERPAGQARRQSPRNSR